MARSAAEIRDALSQTVRTTNPNTDLSKGPAFNVMLAPFAPELAETEQQIEDARTIASFQIANAVTLAEINAIGTNFGLKELSGLKATTKQTFFTVSRPTSDLTIERGTVVSSTDGLLSFVVTERGVMRAAQIDAYRNASRRRYEIVVSVEAVAAGEDYNLPAFRLTRLLTPVVGIDGTENRVEATGGTERQSFDAYVRRIRRKFQGLSPESGGGIISAVFEYDPEIVKDVIPVFPKDRKIFRRDTGRPAMDLYVLGERENTATQQFVSVGSTSTIVLDNQPVNSIGSVLVDGTPVTDFALLADTRASVSGSARAEDKLILGTTLTDGQVCEIAYAYNQTINEVQSELLDTQESLFGTDVLARKFEKVDVTVQVDIIVLPSFDSNRISDQATTTIFTYCEPVFFVNSISPEELVERLRNTISGVANVRISKFTSTRFGTLPVETINFEKNQIPVVDVRTLVVTTRQ